MDSQFIIIIISSSSSSSSRGSSRSSSSSSIYIYNIYIYMGIFIQCELRTLYIIKLWTAIGCNKGCTIPYMGWCI